ncbi:shikimate dehydrogenase family protein [Croceivirga thetidis]|uniref:Shikimate dehydrogenase n=1 Tax=Croceivirga thetidis TaxID=2721623 RepID=A0ABX1GT81_9FLAO|nr:shikimate dehydrogenase [Croceivirga thetidis]NKI32853.1 shikimate dehydrogenase [Croceivirga thetidis]
MEKTGKHKKRYGLVGRNISYSFSKGYFSKKFENLGLNNHSYENFDLTNIEEFKDLLVQHNLSGLNVTIPYKEQVIPFLNELEGAAKKIGAVNTIKFSPNGIKGFNTDAFGFQKSLEKKLKLYHNNALILGTGGASKAVAFVFEQLDINYKFVSRAASEEQFSYEELDEDIITSHQIIVNCTPLGTYPNIEDKPDIPYKFLNSSHFLFDLIYNPDKTAFLKSGEAAGAQIQNGALMLQYQAEEAWRIWNS